MFSVLIFKPITVALSILQLKGHLRSFENQWEAYFMWAYWLQSEVSATFNFKVAIFKNHSCFYPV